MVPFIIVLCLREVEESFVASSVIVLDPDAVGFVCLSFLASLVHTLWGGADLDGYIN